MHTDMCLPRTGPKHKTVRERTSGSKACKIRKKDKISLIFGLKDLRLSK
jgi:uncharacterized protein YdeI (YjbR/CyaY-like superfamily)